MDKLLADLNVLDIKLHNYHYNVVGQNFIRMHLTLEDEYELMHDWIDEIAERIKQNGAFPPASMKDYLALAQIKEAESKDYRWEEIVKCVLDDYEYLVKEIMELRKTQDDVTLAVFDDIQKELEKKIWFFKSILK